MTVHEPRHRFAVTGNDYFFTSLNLRQQKGQLSLCFMNVHFLHNQFTGRFVQIEILQYSASMSI